MSNVTSLSRRRRLTDLYIRGKELSLNDNTDEEPIVVWVSKISPLENRDAAERASQVRATILAAKYLDDHDDGRIQYLDQLSELGDRDNIINFLILPKLQEAQLSHEAELASEDKWSKDNYYASLLESWNSGMAEKYQENPKDTEAKKVFSELTKFANEVEKRVDADRIDLQSTYDIKSDEEIRREAIDRLIDTESDFAWLAEFRKWQIFFAVREPGSHKDRYFLQKEEVDALDPRILAEIVNTFLEVSVDSLEGKDLGEIPNS